MVAHPWREKLTAIRCSTEKYSLQVWSWGIAHHASGLHTTFNEVHRFSIGDIRGDLAGQHIISTCWNLWYGHCSGKWSVACACIRCTVKKMVWRIRLWYHVSVMRTKGDLVSYPISLETIVLDWRAVCPLQAKSRSYPSLGCRNRHIRRSSAPRQKRDF